MKQLALLALPLAALGLSSPAWACGGCFSPASVPIQQTVVQEAERVLFVRDEATGTSHVWVEVRYSGLAKDFGWVLPVPKVPKVGVGSRMLFDQLDQSMQIRYDSVTGLGENCRNAFEGCDFPKVPSGGVQDAGALSKDGMASETAGSGQPQVQVLAQGSTGPYDYSVVQGSDAAVLYNWLNARGYAMPDKAKPILQSHLAKGDVFVAIKLSNGQGIQDIRPVALEMQDAEPCVPLRLTSIAAKEDLSVVVTVAGSGRAIVKNHLDIVPNPLRMALTGNAGEACNPKASDCNVPLNYWQLVSAGIDSVGGHAFVTESSVAGKSVLTGAAFPESALIQLSAATNMAELAMMMAYTSLPMTDEVADAIALPLALTQTFPEDSPLQTLANLRACGVFWQMGTASPCTPLKAHSSYAQLQKIAVDGPGAKVALEVSVVQPMANIRALISNSPRVTRLMMRISPEEMDRDPVFAFHATLPMVQPLRQFKRNFVCLDGWSNGPAATRITWDGLGSWVFAGLNTLDKRFANAPLVLQATLQDEAGDPVLLDPSQYELVDTAILGALPGKPSLPKDMVLKNGGTWQPPPSDQPVSTVGPWKKPAGACIPKPGWVDGKAAPTASEVADAGATDALPTASQPAHVASSGCQTGAQPGNGWWMAALLAGVLAWRRRVA